jgi:hypothetical protein
MDGTSALCKGRRPDEAAAARQALRLYKLIARRILEAAKWRVRPSWAAMSQLGQKRTSHADISMSALCQKATSLY